MITLTTANSQYEIAIYRNLLHIIIINTTAAEKVNPS